MKARPILSPHLPPPLDLYCVERGVGSRISTRHIQAAHPLHQGFSINMTSILTIANNERGDATIFSVDLFRNEQRIFRMEQRFASGLWVSGGIVTEDGRDYISNAQSELEVNSDAGDEELKTATDELPLLTSRKVAGIIQFMGIYFPGHA